MTTSYRNIVRFCLVFLAVGILRASPSEAASTVAITKPSAGAIYQSAQTVGLVAGSTAGTVLTPGLGTVVGGFLGAFATFKTKKSDA